MKNYSGSVGINWNWFTICLIGFSALLLMVLYFPGLRDIDLVILKTIRKFLEPYPSYIPVFFSNYGGVSNYIWPQITVTAVLISHQKYIKAFLVVFFTQGSYWLVDFIKDIICRERPCLHPGYSFPSGHTTSTACLCGIVIYLASRYVSNTFWKYLYNKKDVALKMID